MYIILFLYNYPEYGEWGLEPLPGTDHWPAFKCKLRPFTKGDQALSRSASFSVHSLIIMAFLVLDASHEY